jgi:Sucrase/ferredoxin-like
VSPAIGAREVRPRCSTEARERGDQLFATASHVRTWLLVEQPGAWGRDAVRQSKFPAALAGALHARTHPLGIRVLLIRRPDRRPVGVNVFLAHTGGHRTMPLLVHGVMEEPQALLDLDLHPLTRGEPVGFGSPAADPLYLVCTNGRHDVCCAERGRPLFRRLDSELGERVWECSHIGGDRFAGNLLCLPHGLYYCWLEPDQASRVAHSYAEGLLNLELLRGRSAWPPDVQAAEHFLRRDLGLVGVDDVQPVRRHRIGGGEARIELVDRSGGRHTVTVAPAPREPALLTCTAEAPATPREFRLLGIVSGA